MRKVFAVIFGLSACGALTPPAQDAGLPDAGVEPVDAGFDAGFTVDAGPCDGGFCRPERITAELIDPWDLVVDDTNLYWLEYGLATNGLDGQVMKQAKDTVCLRRDAGCAVDLNTRVSGRFRVDSITKAGDELCWTENYANARDVVCQSVITDTERILASTQPGATEPVAVGGQLWWVNFGTSAAAQDGQVMRKSLTAAGAPQVMVPMRAAPNSVAIASGNIVWAEAGLSIDAGAVLAQPLDGGALVAVANGQRTPLSVIECGDALYWVNYRDNAVMRGTLDAGSGVAIVTGQRAPFQIVCDKNTLYWLNAGVSASGGDGELWQSRLDGTESTVMVQGVSLAWALTIDDTYVYYIAQGTQTRIAGEIWRIRKHR